jgi:hypothetical protein
LHFQLHFGAFEKCVRLEKTSNWYFFKYFPIILMCWYQKWKTNLKKNILIHFQVKNTFESTLHHNTKHAQKALTC